MELRHNKTTSCPTCGCTTVVCESLQLLSSGRKRKRRIVSVHTNGGKWETREFLCGYSCEYVPNLEKVQDAAPCLDNPEAFERAKRAEKLRNQISSLEKELHEIGHTRWF